MNQQRTDTRDIGSLSGSQDCILEQCRTEARTLMLQINRQARLDHHWHWMSRNALEHARRSVFRINAADGETVKPRDVTVHATDVGLSAVG